ncbi:hypothetical protein L484_027741 [Morus notabilis]|uniref:Uncharacterized protein n=1 Tax=Morus notabilis TaxID=981085 RepID=W9S1M9_9ROSA|nr:hypothetical protein L484_027741 [Morus notabilis]
MEQRDNGLRGATRHRTPRSNTTTAAIVTGEDGLDVACDLAIHDNKGISTILKFCCKKYAIFFKNY